MATEMYGRKPHGEYIRLDERSSLFISSSINIVHNIFAKCKIRIKFNAASYARIFNNFPQDKIIVACSKNGSVNKNLDLG